MAVACHNLELGGYGSRRSPGRRGEGRYFAGFGLTGAFTSRVTLDRANHKIMVEYLQGPFSQLENRWTFVTKAEDSCEVGFFIAYEFKSRMLGMLMGTMFDTAFQRFAAAFEKRADQVYGTGRLSSGT